MHITQAKGLPEKERPQARRYASLSLEGDLRGGEERRGGLGLGGQVVDQPLQHQALVARGRA